MKICLKNIGKLYLITEKPNMHYLRGKDMKNPFYLENAWLIIEEDKILDYGFMHDPFTQEVNEIIDCNQGIVLPGFVDSHTHTLFAGTRDHELIMKLKGFTYEEIT